MGELSPDERARFDRAVSVFEGEGDIRVTVDSIRAFLDATAGIHESPVESLRQLAIRLESGQFEHGWKGLRAIYEAAAAADPGAAIVLHSWGIAAVAWMEEWKTASMPERVEIAHEAERVLTRALDLAPRTPCFAHSLGLLFYNHPERPRDEQGHLDRAIRWFAQAVEWEPRLDIAQLYLAHCFHDRQDWARAISEYERVDLGRLAAEWPAWRAFKCREQLAHCYARLGRSEEALRRFSELLDEIEWMSAEAADDLITDLDDLVDAVTGPLHDDRLRLRVKKLANRLAWFEERYSRWRPRS